MTRSANFLLSTALVAVVAVTAGHRSAENSAPTGLEDLLLPNSSLATGGLPSSNGLKGLAGRESSKQIEIAQAFPPPVTIPAEGTSDALPAETAPATPSEKAEAPLDAADKELLAKMDAPAAPLVDESALRYFARQGDTPRLQAEINRLKALYPDWQPPADPLAPRAASDEALEQMWTLSGNGRYALLRKAIARRQEKQPGWQPPAELVQQLELGEARQRLITASNDKAYDRVVEEGAAHPQLLVCGDMDSLWRVAEAFAKTGREQRAQDAYRYILSSCDAPKERLATLQKATLLLPPASIVDLLTLERTDAAGKGEFESVRNDLARRFLSLAAKDPAAQVPQDFVTRMEGVAESEHKASDALLLGWYHERRQKMVQAEYWFRKARAAEDSAEAAQGLALTLIARKMPQEAEDILYRWRAESDEVHATYLAAAAETLALDPPVALAPDVLARMSENAAEVRDAALAEQFGWYARAFDQPQQALQWFATSLTWKRDNEPAAFGLVLTAHDLKLTDVVTRIQAEWAGRSSRIQTLGKTAAQAPASRAVTAYTPTGGDSAPSALDRLFSQTGTSGNVEDGGRLLDVAAPIESEPTTRSLRTSGRGQAAAPVVVAQAAPSMIRQREVAEVSTEAEPQRRVVRAKRAAGSARGCTNRVDTSSLSPAANLQRGWCLMELKRPAEATRAFEAALASNDAKVRGDAAYGQSLAYLRLGLTDKASISSTRGRMDQQKASEIQVALLTNRALSAYQAKRYTEALLLLDRRAELAPERADLMVIRGYAYMGMQRYPQAIRIFENVASTGNRDAIKGLAEARAANNPIPGK
ncbi:tetratricopeptide repeat protein [Rhizobium sp. YIM 134829]|uniref:tetratricopeptide repeat protein n=1 Tax=Rhizobium sp. YIM 134829 TaxID=3390453 RepID=UPI00397BCC71